MHERVSELGFIFASKKAISTLLTRDLEEGMLESDGEAVCEGFSGEIEKPRDRDKREIVTQDNVLTI